MTERGADVVKEPQGVRELMEQTEAAWRAEIAACDDATAPEREALREALGALRAEYAEADYPRREAIQGELRALIRRHEALSRGAAPEAAAPEPEATEAVAEPRIEAEPAPEIAPKPVPEGPHAPVPLGVEAAMPREAGQAPPAPEPPPAPPPEPPRVAPSETPRLARGGRRPESAPRATGPVPHGAFRPAAAPETGPGPEPEPQPEAGTEGGEAGPERWRGGRGRTDSALRRWLTLARLAVEHQVLLSKREARWLELGVRVWQLGRKDALGDAAGDAGVRERLKQVEQVEAALRANRDRWDDLRGPG